MPVVASASCAHESAGTWPNTGTTNNRKLTKDDTVVPGKHITGTPLNTANPCGPPGCCSTWPNHGVAGESSATLHDSNTWRTTSNLPALIPPEVTTTSGCRFLIAAASEVFKSEGSSLVDTCPTTWIPAAEASARIIGAFASGIVAESSEVATSAA